MDGMLFAGKVKSDSLIVTRVFLKQFVHSEFHLVCC